MDGLIFDSCLMRVEDFLQPGENEKNEDFRRPEFLEFMENLRGEIFLGLAVRDSSTRKETSGESVSPFLVMKYLDDLGGVNSKKIEGQNWASCLMEIFPLGFIRWAWQSD